jgi:signal transduction histidine kinase
VTVSIARQNAEIVYRICDDGPGVPTQEQEQIFEPGGQGLAGRTNGDGAGLGLALARRLARSVTGDVTLAPGETGATFVVRLPAA